MKTIKLRIKFEDPEVIVYAGKIEIDKLTIFPEHTRMLTCTGRFELIEQVKETASIEFEKQNDLKENQEYQICTYNYNKLFAGTERQCIKYAKEYLYAKYALEEEEKW